MLLFGTPVDPRISDLTLQVGTSYLLDLDTSLPRRPHTCISYLQTCFILACSMYYNEYLATHSLNQLLTHLLRQLLAHSHTHSIYRLLTNLHIHFLTHSLPCSLTHLLTHSLTHYYSLNITHSLSLTHSLTHSTTDRQGEASSV